MKTDLESLWSSLRREAEEVIRTKKRKTDEKRESLQATNQAQASSTSRTASSSKADKVELRGNKDKTEVDRLLLELTNLIGGLAKQEMGKEGEKQFVLTFDDLLTIGMHDEFERRLLNHLKTRSHLLAICVSTVLFDMCDAYNPNMGVITHESKN